MGSRRVLHGQTRPAIDLRHRPRHRDDPRDGRRRPRPGAEPVAAWDFSREIATDTIVDTAPGALHGRAVNMPMRAVTGPCWTGREIDFRAAPDEYDAIHFHDDDLDDARWLTDLELTVPDDWPSGVYAAHLRTGESDDYVPFVVRPPHGGSGHRIALLLPTVTYIAYGNEHMMGGYITRQSPDYAAATDAVIAHGSPYEAAAFRYITETGLNSLYDLHADFTGVCYSSRLRPLVNMRPQVQQARAQVPAHARAELRPLHGRLADREGLRLRRHHRRRPASRGPFRAVALPGGTQRFAPRVLDVGDAHRAPRLPRRRRPADVPGR